MSFQKRNKGYVQKKTYRCKRINGGLVPGVYSRQTIQNPCFNNTSLDTQAVESQSSYGSGIIDCHMDTENTNLNIEKKENWLPVVDCAKTVNKHPSENDDSGVNNVIYSSLTHEKIYQQVSDLDNESA